MSQCRFHLHTIGCHPGVRELFPATSHCQQSHLLSKACFSSSAGSIYGSLPSTLSTPTAKAAWASSWRSVCQPEFAFHRLIHPDIASKYPRVGDRGGGGGANTRNPASLASGYRMVGRFSCKQHGLQAGLLGRCSCAVVDPIDRPYSHTQRSLTCPTLIVISIVLLNLNRQAKPPSLGYTTAHLRSPHPSLVPVPVINLSFLNLVVPPWSPVNLSWSSNLSKPRLATQSLLEINGKSEMTTILKIPSSSPRGVCSHAMPWS